MSLKKTILYNLHKKFDAKFVSFAGYEMPIQYKDGIISEHNITRQKSGIFDVSHMGQLYIEGDDKLTIDLQKIFPIDLKKLAVNQSKYSFLMNENAGIDDDLIITKLEKGYMIILNAACKEKDFNIIKSKLDTSYKMFLKEDLSLIAVQGPESKNIIEKIVPGVGKLKFMHGNKFVFKSNEIYVTRSGYTGEDGFEISVLNSCAVELVEKLISNGSKLIGLGARDTLRLEAGLCLYGHDLNEEISPLEANLKWALSKSRINTDYPGSKKIIKQLNDGVKKLRVGIKPEGKIIARESTKIFDKNNKQIGLITSGTFGPSVKSPIAMGYVDNTYAKVDTRIFLEIRGKKIPANVCEMPFYKKSYFKGDTNVRS
tara:strand:- start:2921 stop:4033 length:1113 start_codon:yes stop_codon:yes gene_type:complete